MNDMAATTTVKSDQVNAADLLGGSITVTIDRVNIDMNNDQPVSMRLVGMDKVYRPCKIMRRVMVENWGADASQYVGRSLTLYCDPNVRFGKDQPGGTRISHMSHIDADKVSTLMVSKGKFAPHRVKVLEAQKPAPSQAAVQADLNIQAEALAVAKNGAAAFKAWWSANPDKRLECKGIMDTLKAACQAADKAMEADPFGLPPITDTRPTPEEMAAAEQAALAAMQVTE